MQLRNSCSRPTTSPNSWEWKRLSMKPELQFCVKLSSGAFVQTKSKSFNWIIIDGIPNTEKRKQKRWIVMGKNADKNWHRKKFSTVCAIHFMVNDDHATACTACTRRCSAIFASAIVLQLRKTQLNYILKTIIIIISSKTLLWCLLCNSLREIPMNLHNAHNVQNYWISRTQKYLSTFLDHFVSS